MRLLTTVVTTEILCNIQLFFAQEKVNIHPLMKLHLWLVPLIPSKYTFIRIFNFLSFLTKNFKNFETLIQYKLRFERNNKLMTQQPEKVDQNLFDDLSEEETTVSPNLMKNESS